MLSRQTLVLHKKCEFCTKVITKRAEGHTRVPHNDICTNTNEPPSGYRDGFKCYCLLGKALEKAAEAAAAPPKGYKAVFDVSLNSYALPTRRRERARCRNLVCLYCTRERRDEHVLIQGERLAAGGQRGGRARALSRGRGRRGDRLAHGDWPPLTTNSILPQAIA